MSTTPEKRLTFSGFAIGTLVLAFVLASIGFESLGSTAQAKGKSRNATCTLKSKSPFASKSAKPSKSARGKARRSKSRTEPKRPARTKGKCMVKVDGRKVTLKKRAKQKRARAFSAARGQTFYWGFVNVQPGYVKWGYPTRDVYGNWWIAYTDWTTGSDGARYCFDFYYYAPPGYSYYLEWGYWHPNGPYRC